MSKPQTREYKAKNGKIQHMPSIELCMAMDAESQGFCLACGEVQEGCEPDADKYVCDCCGAPKVYGAAQLVIMGLVF